MKKLACFLLIILLVCASTGCSAVSLDDDAAGVVTYAFKDVRFTEALSAEEISAVIEVLDGKTVESGIFGNPSCGFNYDIAIIIGGRRFCLACDKCGTVQDYRTMGYIHISDAEREVLEEIFTSRGGSFPCI